MNDERRVYALLQTPCLQFTLSMPFGITPTLLHSYTYALFHYKMVSFAI